MIALLEAQRAGLFTARNIARNLMAGLTVGLVALPLAMAFAIASGVKPEQGIYTAIVASLVVSLVGGSRAQIAGPTGAFIVILLDITATHGVAGLQVATLLAGVLLLLLGLFKLGGLIKYIPYPVILGFTTGIAVIIWVGQWKNFFGLPAGETGRHFHEQLGYLITALPQFHGYTTGLALLGLGIVFLTPRRITRYLPSPLLAMVIVTGVQAYGHFPGVHTIGSVFGGIPAGLPALTWPTLKVGTVLELLGPALTIALLGAIESLLSAVVADGMMGTRHDPNQELLGQGLANLLTPLVGGFAATGAIARTATAIKHGGNTPLAGLVHAVTLLVIVVALAPYAASIPLCALAAILFAVAYNMSEVKHFIELARHAPRNDVMVLWVTFFLTVFADLVVAVNAGVILAALLFMKRMAETVRVESQDREAMERHDAPAPGVPLPPGVQVYAIDGPIFFGAIEGFERAFSTVDQQINAIVIRLREVPFVDATALYSLNDLIRSFTAAQVQIILCEANERVRYKLTRAQVVDSLHNRHLQAPVDAVLAELSSPSGGGAASPRQAVG